MSEKVSAKDKNLLKYLSENELTIKDIKDFNRASKVNKPNYIKIGEETDEVIFGVLSCTHYWSKASKPEAVKEYVHIAKEEWAEALFHCWDLADWNNVYKGHKFELKDIAYRDQLKTALEQYPSILPTYMIWWNHDEDFLKSVWADIIEDFSGQREDVTNLWRYNADVDYKGFNIWMQHGWGWQSYAVSYKIQKYLEHIQNQPDLFAVWHRHTPVNFVYRWSIALWQASFQWENLLSKRFALWNTIWAWIVAMRRRADWVVQSKVQFIDMTNFTKNYKKPSKK